MKNLGDPFLEAGIPIDLLMDIFFRVPATTVASCRCVSKLWRSIIGRPDFTELFLTMSWTRPRLLLFAFQSEGKIFFFSSPQPRNPDDNSTLVATRYQVHHPHSPKDFSTDFGSPVGGFICRQDRGKLFTMVISNPVTGESVSLPKVVTKSIHTRATPFLGYDPIDKRFKVLCINFDRLPNMQDEHQILTLENGTHSCRTIQCKPHFPKSNGTCIDGILYYTAGMDRGFKVSMIVCFDVRFEKFSFIYIDDEATIMTSRCQLINYKGKLGALQFTYMSPGGLELWVLEDVGKRKWSICIYPLSPLWTDNLVIVGMTSSGEVVMSPACIIDPFHIYYYNLESNSSARVRIQGLEGFQVTRVYTSLDYVENLKLMTEYEKGVNTCRLSGAEYAIEASKLSEPSMSK